MANTWGYGAMTNHLGDIQNAQNIIIFGANPAVNHPVGFQHFLKAKERNNANIIVVDPRFTRTAAKADEYVRVRSGTDVAIMYGMINLIIELGLADKKYLNDRVYGIDEVIKESKTFTPEKVEEITGVSKEQLIKITKLYASKRPGTLIWAMGLTQHSYGTNNTRLAPILQLILGNVGKAGGGCNILRGHDNVQGATDLGCLANTLPGYYGLKEGSWKHFCRVWDVDFDYIKSRFTKDMLTQKGFTLSRWYEGVLQEDKIYNAGTDLKALVCMANGLMTTSRTHKVVEALNKLELVVIVDPFPHDAVSYIESDNEVFLLPACTQLETEGSVTATNRSIQWRSKVVEPLFDSKPDQEIMFELAKRLGFYDKYTASLGDGKGNFKWPEDATKEITKAIKTIGMSGHTPERLKKHTENWHLFDQVTLRGIGPMKGEYYGLPWPCWDDKHSGSPVLYSIDLPVNEGGMGFRNRFGKERKGVSLLAGDRSAPPKSKQKGGYPEINDKNVEKLTGIKLTKAEKELVKGRNWKTDLSMTLVKKALKAGLAPYGNAKARAVVWGWADEVPKHKEPLHTPRPDIAKEFPTFKDKKNHYRVDTRYSQVQNEKDWSKEFPINLITGRLVTHNGQGIETRISKYLTELDGEMFADINPNLASEFGIRDGDMMWVEGTEGGKIKVKAKFAYSVDEKSIFLPIHFSGWLNGKSLEANYPEGQAPYAMGESANMTTNYGYDIVTQIPETKGGLCKIAKA